MNNQNQKDQSLMDQAALLSFIDQLIKEKNDMIEPTQLNETRATLLQDVNVAINMHLIDLLTEENQNILEELLNREASDEDVSTFFATNIPELRKEITAALVQFRMKYLQNVNEENLPNEEEPLLEAGTPGPLPMKIEDVNEQ